MSNIDSQRIKGREFLERHLFPNEQNGKDNAIALERAIYNWCITTSKRDLVPLTWECDAFRSRYIQRLMSIKFNLLHPKNPDLMRRLRDKEITYTWLATATPYDMYPGLWEPVMEKVAMKQMRRQRTIDIESISDGAFTCGKCRSKKSEYYQLQTRSADEPMTTFVSCVQCGNRWKC